MSATVVNSPALELDSGKVASRKPRPRRFKLGRLTLWLFLGGLACVVTMTSCSLYASGTGSESVQGASETVTAFLNAGSRNDPAAAAALTASKDGQNALSETDIANLFRDRPEFFQDRVSAEVLSWKTTWSTDATSMTLAGRITYGDGSHRDYVAALEKEGEAWKLLGIRFQSGAGSLPDE